MLIWDEVCDNGQNTIIDFMGKTKRPRIAGYIESQSLFSQFTRFCKEKEISESQAINLLLEKALSSMMGESSESASDSVLQKADSANLKDDSAASTAMEAVEVGLSKLTDRLDNLNCVVQELRSNNPIADSVMTQSLTQLTNVPRRDSSELNYPATQVGLAELLLAQQQVASSANDSAVSQLLVENLIAALEQKQELFKEKIQTQIERDNLAQHFEESTHLIQLLQNRINDTEFERDSFQQFASKLAGELKKIKQEKAKLEIITQVWETFCNQNIPCQDGSSLLR